MEKLDIGWWQRRLNQACECIQLSPDFKEWTYDGSHSKCIDFVDKNDSLRSYFNLPKPHDNNSLKSLKKAASCRVEGNKFFSEKSFSRALERYNQGIILAPQNGNNLADNDEYTLCLANRSAVLFHLADYQSCVTDIEEGLKRNYKPKYRLLIRKANSLFHLKKYHKAKKCCKDSLDCLDECNEKVIDKTKLEIHKLLEKMENVTLDEMLDDEKPAFELPKVKGSLGSILTQASGQVKLEFDPAKGRHLLSAKKLEIGDVLIVEKPYVSLLLPSHYDQRCYNCLKVLRNFYPCPSCLDIKFCSPECCEEAMFQYHTLECSLMHVLHEVGVAHLALRVLLVTKPSTLLELRGDPSSGETFVPDEASPLLCDYRAVYHLVHNTDNIGTQDLLQYAMTSVLLLRCLDSVKYFDSFEQTSASEIRSFVGGLLLRHICQLVCNAHAITDLQSEKLSAEVDSEKQVRIATAIYPTVSMMNHSCDPNISASFMGNILVVRASSRIGVGQEILNCYGPHHKHMSKGQRQEVLKEQYGFTCSCPCCLSEKETDFNQLIQAFKCRLCNGKVVEKRSDVKYAMECLDCGDFLDGNRMRDVEEIFQKSRDIFQHGVSLLDRKNIGDAKKMFERCYRLRKDICHDINLKLAEVVDALAQCSALEGNFSSAKEHLKCSLEIVREIYGRDSLELGHDLRKYVEVCIQAGDYLEARQKAREATRIFIRHYGDGHGNVQELSEIMDGLDVVNTR